MTKGKQKGNDGRPVPPSKPILRMHEDEPVNFLQLATAMKILLGLTVSEDTISCGSQLLQDYIFKF
jgi:hypothetical protein